MPQGQVKVTLSTFAMEIEYMTYNLHVSKYDVQCYNNLLQAPSLPFHSTLDYAAHITSYSQQWWLTQCTAAMITEDIVFSLLHKGMRSIWFYGRSVPLFRSTTSFLIRGHIAPLLPACC